MTVEIPLSQGQVALIDDEDAERVFAYRWHARWSPRAQTYYANHTLYFGTPKPPRWANMPMHRFIMQAAEGQDVNHWNQNGLDNRRENLRVCSRSQNNCYSKPRRGKRSKYKGVMLLKSGRWLAVVSLKGKRHSCGTFPTEEEAALAYDCAAVAMHGAFALTNAKLFPDLLKGGAA